MPMLISFTLVLAFCSIVYELLMGQVLSAFLGNTVLRYSVTIGLYMCFKGFGALYAHRPRNSSAPYNLQQIELFLSFLGFSSIFLLFYIDSILPGSWLFSLVAHALVALIGFLTGFELPLLLSMATSSKRTMQGYLIGMDYLGAFLGTIIFAFYFYPVLGLIPSILVVTSLNAVAGLLIAFIPSGGTPRRPSVGIAICQLFLLVAVALLASSAGELEEFCLGQYLGVEGQSL